MVTPNIVIDHMLHAVENAQADAKLDLILTRLSELRGALMASAAELNVKLDALVATVEEIGQDVADLKLLAVEGLSPADADALGARIDAIVARTRLIAAEHPPAVPPGA